MPAASVLRCRHRESGMRSSGAPRAPASRVALGALTLAFAALQVQGPHPACSIVQHLRQREAECGRRMPVLGRAAVPSNATGCGPDWDGVNCWPPVPVGEVVSMYCPQLLRNTALPPVPVIRNCTPHGWSTPSLPYYEACHFEDGPEDTGDKRRYLATVKTIYSMGYGLSLASLISATLVFCVFRTLLCTRTYIHLNLFSSFILRGTAVFVKDAVLFADEGLDHCAVSTVACKVAVALFHCCVLANFSWLLVEGLYLHTVLLFTFAPHRRLLWTFALLGWGFPSVTTVIWIVFKSLYDNRGCCDDLDGSFWWIIKAPILASVLVNFALFVNIIRIIFQKMKASGTKGAEGAQYMRLTKSTLLLMPLFGVHYVVFALFPEHVGFQLRLCFELILGSFQGFVVALLYCFLNGEVQQEVKKQMKRLLRSSEHNIIVVSVASPEHSGFVRAELVEVVPDKGSQEVRDKPSHLSTCTCKALRSFPVHNIRRFHARVDSAANVTCPPLTSRGRLSTGDRTPCSSPSPVSASA